MRILVIGDTHGELSLAKQICKENENKLDLIIHTGDYISDGKTLETDTGICVKAVKGNCDGSMSSSDYLIIDTEFGKIYLAHGHFDNVNHSYDNIVYRAQSLDCKAAIFGHTHIGLFQEENGFYLINPGSLTKPLDGKPKSYAIINTEEKGIFGNILFME